MAVNDEELEAKEAHEGEEEEEHDYEVEVLEGAVVGVSAVGDHEADKGDGKRDEGAAEPGVVAGRDAEEHEDAA